MTLFVLNANDIKLCIYADSKVLAEEPGIAIIGQNGNDFGEVALKQIKQNPRHVNYMYWHRMNLDPLGFTGPRTNNHADLLYQQLRELIQRADMGDNDELVIAVRSNTSNEQLSLLLGVCQECNTKVSGLVDISVALLSRQSVYLRNLVLDTGLQSLTIAGIDVSENNAQQSVKKSQCSEITEMGLLPLMDAWLAIIADRFISDARFDPLRIADTEQQVFDQLYQWLQHPNRPHTLNIEVNYQTITRSIEISESVLIEKASQRYDLVLQKLPTAQNIWLTESSNLLPGFKEALTNAGHSVSGMETTSVYEVVSNQIQHIVRDTGEVQFITAFQISSSSQQFGQEKAPSAGHCPTHIVYQGLALRLRPDTQHGLIRDAFKEPATKLPGGSEEYPVLLTTASRGLKIATPPGSKWLLNGATPGPEQEILAGDKLTMGQDQLEFIRVEDGT